MLNYKKQCLESCDTAGKHMKKLKLCSIGGDKPPQFCKEQEI